VFSRLHARRPRVRSLHRPICASVFLLLLAPSPAAAEDVCRLTGAALRAEVEAGAAEVAETYASTPESSAFALNRKAAPGSVCNWTCGSGRVLTPLVKMFEFLRYNCSSTTAPASVRRRTGPKTDSQLGLAITDAQYHEAGDKIFRAGTSGPGALMQVPRSLELAAASGKVADVVNAVDALPGATWALFRSTSVNNDGQGFDRIIIRVPEARTPPRFEQWIQIAIKEATGTFGRNVDFIAVQLRSDSPSSTKLEPPVVAFRGFSRTDSGFVPEGAGSGDLTKCYSCHPSGLRPVVPAPRLGVSLPRGKKPTISAADITDITSTLGRFGPAGYEAAHNGPPIGPSFRPTRAEFVAKGLPARPGRTAVPGCAARLPKERRQEIVDRMDCQQCHNVLHPGPPPQHGDRGILNGSTSIRTLFHKVVENTVAPMPQGVTDPGGLTASERKVLFECLQAEYAEILQEWLTSDLLAVP
jgi:hypothetical protein